MRLSAAAIEATLPRLRLASRLMELRPLKPDTGVGLGAKAAGYGEPIRIVAEDGRAAIASGEKLVAQSIDMKRNPSKPRAVLLTFASSRKGVRRLRRRGTHAATAPALAPVPAGTRFAMKPRHPNQGRPMTKVTQHWADELKESLDLLKTMRDEMKVQAHLGSMEARARFDSLETRLDHEQLAVRKSFKELIKGFREVRAQLKDNPKTGH